jgi:hypothetical protein
MVLLLGAESLRRSGLSAWGRLVFTAIQIATAMPTSTMRKKSFIKNAYMFIAIPQEI